MIQDKRKENHTHLDAMNFWTPLNDDNDKNKEAEEEINIIKSTPVKPKEKENKWTWRTT